MNSSQLSRSRFEVESARPSPITSRPSSLSFDTSGEKSLSPLRITKVSMWSFEYARSIASTHMRMSAEFLPVMTRLGISISSTAASCSAVV